VEVSAEDARRFLVARQMLAPARSLAGGRDGALEVVRRWGSVQFDPIAIAGRSHDLVLHARVAGYEPQWADELYERREIFEAYNKGLSLVLTDEYPWFRGGFAARSQRVLDANQDVAGRVLDQLRADGPLSALDFERERGAEVDWFGVPRNTVSAVLEAFTDTGVIGLARREGSRRYYDLLERLLPADVLAREVPVEEQFRHKLHSRFRTHGLLAAAGGGGIFSGLGPAKPDPRWPGFPGRTALRSQLVEEGALVAVEIDGLRPKRFVLREEVELLGAPPEPPPTVSFLSPFDPLVWDRGLLDSLFGFQYVWDLFFPPEKRAFGWYVLPVLFRDRFVGRIEPQIELDEDRVRVIDFWWEDGFAPRRADGFVDAMREALQAYLEFAGVSRLDWAPHLTAEKQLFAVTT
jgi:uncharacterized protein YcaQ